MIGRRETRLFNRADEQVVAARFDRARVTSCWISKWTGSPHV